MCVCVCVCYGLNICVLPIHILKLLLPMQLYLKVRSLGNSKVRSSHEGELMPHDWINTLIKRERSRRYPPPSFIPLKERPCDYIRRWAFANQAKAAAKHQIC